MMGKYRQRISSGIVMPLQQFIKREKSAGIVLGLSIVAAMALANSPWSEAYFHLFEHEFGFVVDGEPYLNYSLHHWINDGLMSMFFFVVGLELKREFIGGELADPRHTVLPIGAAVAGMLAPSLGLKSVWVAMCIKLCFRGLIFLVRLKRERWMRHM